MSPTVTPNKLDPQYQTLLYDILTNGHKKSDRTGTGTISVFGRELRHNMSEGFPLLTTKKMHLRGVVTELLWFLKGGTNIRELVCKNCNIWNGDAYKNYVRLCSEMNLKEQPTWANDGQPVTKEVFVGLIKSDNAFATLFGDLGRIYGAQWRDFRWQWYQQEHGASAESTDQITELIQELRRNPDSRRLMVSAWNPTEIKDVVLPPCHYGFQVYTRKLSEWERGRIYEERFPVNTDEVKTCAHFDEVNIPTRTISLRWNQRSCDTPLGIPYNIASYGLLLVILGRMTNMIPEELQGSLGDTHIYTNQVNGVHEQLDRPCHPLPRLVIAPHVYFGGTIDDMLSSCDFSDFKVENYYHEPAIEFPLSN